MSYERESDSYVREVKSVAADLIREGKAAPWQAIGDAHEIVQERRQRRAKEARREAKGK